MLGGLGIGAAGQTYLYIDAGYLLPEYEAPMTAFFKEPGAIDLGAIRDEAHANKVYYYDCVDEIPRAGESPADLAERIAAKDAELRQIRRLPRFHVREGVVRGRGRAKRQKMVDVQLAVDMLMHRVTGVVSRAVLIAGDLDFLPIVEGLVQLGVNVAVWHGENAAEDLLASADESRRLTLADFVALSTYEFRASHKRPIQSGDEGEPGGRLLRSGTWRGRRVLLKTADERSVFWLYVEEEPPDVSMTLTFVEEAALLHYFSLIYGEINWGA
jgi:uncharacterized LabA/DUF88 family protein